MWWFLKNNPQVIFLFQVERCLWMWPFLGQEQHIHPQRGVPPLWFFGVRASAGSLTVGREHRHSLWKANLKQVSVHPAFLDCLWLCFMSWLSGNLLLCNSPEVACTSELGLCLARLGRASSIQQCLLNVKCLYLLLTHPASVERGIYEGLGMQDSDRHKRCSKWTLP